MYNSEVVNNAGSGVVAAAAMDNEDGVQLYRRGGHSMAAAAFDGDSGRGYG